MKRIGLMLLLLGLLTKIYAQGTWSSLGTGIPLIYPGVIALSADTVNNVLYAGGEFDSAGSVAQNALAKWDGTKWDTTVRLDSGTQVNALIMYKGNLIIGFSDGSVGEYNGSKLNYMPGFSAAVWCFYIYNDTLYAGGEFYKSGNTILNCIGKWNGTKWLPVDTGFTWYDCCPIVVALTEYNGDLIASGTFNIAGSATVSSLAAYNGSKWKSMGVTLTASGIEPYNAALGVYNNKLYVSGSFDHFNYVAATSGMVSWDGTNWDTVFNNAYSYPVLIPSNISITSFDGYMFVSGGYAGQIPYKYDGDTLSTVDSGTGGGINAMTAWNGSLYVGGFFNWAYEARPHTPCIARWTPDSTTGIKQTVKDNVLVSVYPNPTSNQLSFSSSGSIKQIQVEDILGQTLIEQNFITGLQKGTIDVSALTPGIYFYRATDSNSQVVTGKFVKE